MGPGPGSRSCSRAESACSAASPGSGKKSLIDYEALGAVQNSPAILQKLTATWAGIQPENLSLLGNDANLRIGIYRIVLFSGRPSHLTDDFGRPIKLNIAHKIAAPGVLLVEPAVVDQHPLQYLIPQM